MKLATAFVEVRPDTKTFKPELEANVTRDASDVTRKLAGVLAGGAFLAGAKKATDAASLLQQAVGGTSAVFGEARGEVEQFAKSAAESAGLSERAARELTSSLGGLLKGFKFTNEEAATLSIKLATLGADLAATFGGTPEEAVQALGAALRGETDPLERFGIALNQTAVNAKAVELGLAATTSSVDQNAKAQATLALIYERSADAAGQFAREADTAAGQAAISAAKMENSAADLGTNLLPIYTKISEVVGVVADGFAALPEPVQTAAIALAAIVALSGPTKLAIEAIGSLATITRTVLTKSLDTAAIGAYGLAGNLGKVALGLGAVGSAVGIAALIWDDYNKRKREAAEATDALTDAIQREREGLEGEVESVALGALLEGDLGEAIRGAGADLDVFAAAIQSNGEEVGALSDSLSGLGNLDEMGDLEVALTNAGLAGSDLAVELLRLQDAGELSAGHLDELIDRLGIQADGFANATRETDNKAAADEAAGKAAGDAAPKVDKLAEKLDLNEQAAKDAAESVDLFRIAVEKALAPLDLEEAVDARAQAFADIAAGIADRSEALDDAKRRLADLRAIPVEERPEDFAQQVRDAEADIQAALDDTSLSLDANTEAARRNREDVRGLIDDVVTVIEKHREEGASLEELTTIRDLERQGLIDQLEQMGFNRAEIDRYIAVLDAIPLTKATTVTVETAKAEEKLRRLLEGYKTLIDIGLGDRADAAQIEKFLVRSARPLAAGGIVTDGLFKVGERGEELLRKRGSQVEVIAGAPSAIGGAGMVNHFTIVAPDVENGLLAADRIMRQREAEAV